MTTTLTPTTAQHTLDEPSPTNVEATNAQLTQRSVTRAEWIKFTSVRSNIITLAAAGVLLVAFGALFSSLAGSGESFGPEEASSDSLTMSLSGIDLSLLFIGVLGAVFVAGEYSTGMIRTMFANVPDRLRVLRAKAIVLGAVSWMVMTVGSFAVFFVGREVYGGDSTVYALSDDGVLRAVLGGGVYGAGIALIGVALGFLLRSTAASIATLVITLMIAPGLVGLLPDPAGTNISKLMPGNAGEAFISASGTSDLLSPVAGFAVFTVWIVGLLGLAALVVRRRDA